MSPLWKLGQKYKAKNWDIKHYTTDPIKMIKFNRYPKYGYLPRIDEDDPFVISYFFKKY